MQPAPVGSFVRFTVGFLTFITVSFGVTIAVNTYAMHQDAQRQTASAFEAMIAPAH